MKFLTALAAFVAGAATLVSAQDAGIYFTQPILGTVWNAGTSQNITWTPANATSATIDIIELRSGDASNLAFVQNISTTAVDLNSGSFVWTIPATLTTNTAYAIAAKNAAGYSYSGYFTILGLAPGVDPSTAAAAGAATTTAAAAADAASATSVTLA